MLLVKNILLNTFYKLLLLFFFSIFCRLPENKLTDFPNLTFVANTLKRLDVSKNTISAINRSSLEILNILEALNVGGNPLREIPDVTVLGKSLNNLNFKNAIKTEARARTFYGFTNLTQVFLSSCGLKSFPNFTYIASQVTWIGLNVNLISSIPSELLNMLINLRRLELSKNLIQHFPDVPGPGRTLLQLDLSNNLLTEFPALPEIGSNLYQLSLVDNNIMAIDPKNLLLNQRRQVTYGLQINLNGNYLKTIPPIIGRNLSVELVTIYARKAPLVCDSDLAWIALSNVHHSCVCDQPDHLKGRSLNSLNYTDLVNSTQEGENI